MAIFSLHFLPYSSPQRERVSGESAALSFIVSTHPPLQKTAFTTNDRLSYEIPAPLKMVPGN
jgi:hypothetical protein